MQKERKRTEEVRHQSTNSFFPAYFHIVSQYGRGRSYIFYVMIHFPAFRQFTVR